MTLADYRNAQNLSQQDVADRLEVSQSRVSRWESGQMPEFDDWKRIARVYKVTIEQMREWYGVP